MEVSSWMLHCIQNEKIGYRVGFTYALFSPPIFVSFVDFEVPLSELLDSARRSHLE